MEWPEKLRQRVTPKMRSMLLVKTALARQCWISILPKPRCPCWGSTLIDRKCKHGPPATCLCSTSSALLLYTSSICGSVCVYSAPQMEPPTHSTNCPSVLRSIRACSRAAVARVPSSQQRSSSAVNAPRSSTPARRMQCSSRRRWLTVTRGAPPLAGTRTRVRWAAVSAAKPAGALRWRERGEIGAARGRDAPPPVPTAPAARLDPSPALRRSSSPLLLSIHPHLFSPAGRAPPRQAAAAAADRAGPAHTALRRGHTRAPARAPSCPPRPPRLPPPSRTRVCAARTPATRSPLRPGRIRLCVNATKTAPRASMRYVSTAHCIGFVRTAHCGAECPFVTSAPQFNCISHADWNSAAS
eukprot:438963-Rhodomonas_salina.2